MDLIENRKIISIADMNSKNIPILEKLELVSVVKCIPKLWKENTYNQNIIDFLSFNAQQRRDIETKMKSKDVYKSIIQKIIVTPLSEHLKKNSTL